jgi:hypothetical protein
MCTHASSLQHISYAKGKSDAVAKEDGTYKPRMKKKPEEEVAKPAGKKGAAAHGGTSHNGEGLVVWLHMCSASKG